MQAEARSRRSNASFWVSSKPLSSPRKESRENPADDFMFSYDCIFTYSGYILYVYIAVAYVFFNM